MLITKEIFQSFLKCATKAHLQSVGTAEPQPEYTGWQHRVGEDYKRKGLAQLRLNFPEEQCFSGMLLPEEFGHNKYSLVTECVVQTDGLQSNLHAFERLTYSDKKRREPYIPIRFIAAEKISSYDKLLLAFDAVVLSFALGVKPPFGKIIHGKDEIVTKIKLPDLIEKAKTVIGKISAIQTNSSAPPLILNKHCTECEYKKRCRQIAVEKDELSLLSGLGEKERKKQHTKGIFTVTQLSYTYHPRRRPKRLASKPDNYSHALKALAIRENKIHIAGSPKLNIAGTPVYLDVEGAPDQDFYYLIGLRIKREDSFVQHSFWADDMPEEKEIWKSFLKTLSLIENPQLVHYGSYETTFLKQMNKRYGTFTEGTASLDQLAKEAVNVLSIIYPHIYFPVYSNSLKEIASYLGFQWSERNASGFVSLLWRSEWERTQDASLKQKLTTYNAEDCAALVKVTSTVVNICQKQNQDQDCVVYTDLMQGASSYRFKKNDFAVPELEYVNQAAYWDYQRDKIYVKSSLQIKRSVKNKTKKKKKLLQENVTVEYPPPDSCLRCGNTNIRKDGRCGKTVQDIKFGKTSLKRWIVKYLYDRYKCCQCGFSFLPPQRPKEKFGYELAAYAIYQIIDLRIPQLTVCKTNNLLLGIQMNRSTINRQKSEKASFYKGTYEAILQKLKAGRLIHADETKTSVGGNKGYVWVLTSLEEVIYFFAPSREGETIKLLLQDFKGVLVSDFYSAYDSIECAQQKCLIHLIRDLNDDLIKQPFNEELKTLVRHFTLLIKPMIETIDRFGLKTRFLRKHKNFVDKFYKEISKESFQSEIGVYYKKRFDKNKDKLFTFLDYDDVPWNNNNAEHAIKAFAGLRRVIGGTSTEKGIREYLILLSICETCKCKGANFLDFLRSGEKDIDAFSQARKNKAKYLSPSS